MKKILVLAMLFVTTPAVTFGQTSSGGKTEQEITALYHEYRSAVEKREVAALERILADGYTSADVIIGTKQTKAIVIEGFKNSPLPPGPAGRSETVNIGDPVISIHGDTAILTNRMIQKGQDPRGQAFSVPILLTTVFTKRGGQWRIVANHGCRIDYLQSESGISPTTSRVGNGK